MAATELNQTAPRQLSSELPSAWLGAYAAVWGVTLSATLVVAAVEPLKPKVRHLLGLHLQANETPAPRLGHVIALAAHNVPIAAWPLLLGVLGAHRHDLGRRAADAVLAGCIVVNVLPVGAALGAYGPQLIPYVPQLPLEWAGFALGVSAWLLTRRAGLTLAQAITLAALMTGVLLCAGALETFAVPHR